MVHVLPQRAPEPAAMHIDDLVEQSEEVLWRGAPDVEAFVRWRRPASWMTAAGTGAAAFLVLTLLGGEALWLNAALGLAVAFVALPFRERRIRTQWHLGQYALTDRRVLRIDERGRPAALPREDIVSIQRRRRHGAVFIEFQASGRGRLRFNCLEPRSAETLVRLLARERR
jgi:hypothetical protein